MDDPQKLTYTIFVLGEDPSREYALDFQFVTKRANPLGLKKVTSLSVYCFDEMEKEKVKQLFKQLEYQLEYVTWIEASDAVDLSGIPLNPNMIRVLDSGNLPRLLSLPPSNWKQLQSVNIWEGQPQLPDAPNAEEVVISSCSRPPLEIWPNLKTKYPKVRRIRVMDNDWVDRFVRGVPSSQALIDRCIEQLGSPICDIETRRGFLWAHLAAAQVSSSESLIEFCHSKQTLEACCPTFSFLIITAIERRDRDLIYLADTEFLRILRSRRTTETELVEPAVLHIIMQMQTAFLLLQEHGTDQEMKRTKFWMDEFRSLSPFFLGDLECLFPFWEQDSPDEIHSISAWVRSCESLFVVYPAEYEWFSKNVFEAQLVPAAHRRLAFCQPSAAGPEDAVELMDLLSRYPTFPWLERADYTFGHSMVLYYTHWYLRCNHTPDEWNVLTHLLRGARERQDKFVVGADPNATHVVMQYLRSRDAKYLELAELTLYCFADSMSLHEDNLALVLTKDDESVPELWRFYDIWFSVWGEVPLPETYELYLVIFLLFDSDVALKHRAKLEPILEKFKNHPKIKYDN
jgi:hypothetical protein